MITTLSQFHVDPDWLVPAGARFLFSSFWQCRQYIFRGRSYGATGLRCATCRVATDAAGRKGCCEDWFVLCGSCFTAGGGMGGAGHGHPKEHSYEILPLPGQDGGSGWKKPAPPPPPVGSRPRRGPWG